MHSINNTRTQYGETQDVNELPEVMKRVQEQLKWHEENDHPAKKHYIVVEYDHTINFWTVYIEWKYRYPEYGDQIIQHQDTQQLINLRTASQKHAATGSDNL